jgi:hypothetical protein
MSPYSVAIPTLYSLCDEILEYFVHHGLEGSWTVGEAKVHDQWFEEISICSECGLPLIAILNTDIIVSPSYIEFGEVSCALESMYEIINEGEGVLILSCDDNECLIVLDKMELTILLLDEVARASSRNASISVCLVSIIG